MPFPVPTGDLFNAGYHLRDRGRYKNTGTFTWLPSGNNGFTGVVLGYAPGAGLSASGTIFTVNGSIGIDGGTAIPVYGMGAIEIDRWCAGSVQVNGGIAWGIAYPSYPAVPSSYAVTGALDRVFKDGTWAAIDHQVQYGSPGSSLTFTTNIVNQAGSGVLKACSWMVDYVPPGTTTDTQLALDISTDGVYRFTVGLTWLQTLSNDGRSPGGTASFGFIKYTSNLTVGLRRSHSGTQLQVWASVLHYLGA